MARYYTVFSNGAKATMEAVLMSKREGVSMTVFGAMGTDDMFLVGPTSGAPDLIESGCIAMVSMQAHYDNPYLDGPVPSWAEREEEVACHDHS